MSNVFLAGREMCLKAKPTVHPAGEPPRRMGETVFKMKAYHTSGAAVDTNMLNIKKKYLYIREF